MVKFRSQLLNTKEQELVFTLQFSSDVKCHINLKSNPEVVETTNIGLKDSLDSVQLHQIAALHSGNAMQLCDAAVPSYAETRLD